MTDHTDEQMLNRRSFLNKAGLGVAGFAASTAILAACSTTEVDDATGAAVDDDDASGAGEGSDDSGGSTDSETVTPIQTDGPEFEWNMATSWPTSLVTLFGAAQIFADQVSDLTGGKFIINPAPAGEIVGGLDVLPAVRDGGAEMGHTASYYYTGLSPVQQFGTAVPFGLTQRQQNAWLYQGGGLELLNEFYAAEHGIIAFPAGGTGCQMGGWFSKEINTVDDLQGLKMRIPGVIAGTVLTNLGGEQVTVAGGEILTSIQTGAIDAAEFVGPTDDLILGLDELGSDLFYYHPGWWEPGTALEVQMPLDLWEELPPTYQAAVRNAAAHANMQTMATYDVLNQRDLQTIKEFAQIREFSPELMAAFKAETESVLDQVAADDEQFAAILGPWREFRDGIVEWHGLAERSYLTQQTQV